MQEGRLTEIDALGSRLSKEIGCPVRWSGRGKGVFICSHGMAIPASRLKEGSDWSWAAGEHKRWVK